MTKPKKKPKTGDAVGWAIVNEAGYRDTATFYRTRKQARLDANHLNIHAWGGPYRIAKIVLAK